MANISALEGKRCPKCGNEDKFELGVRVWATVLDDGIEDYEDPEWEEDAPARCSHCGHSDAWSDFDALLAVPEPFQRVVDEARDLFAVDDLKTGDTHPEYVRALLEVVTRTLGYTSDDSADVGRLLGLEPADVHRLYGTAAAAEVAREMPHSRCANCGQTIWWDGDGYFSQGTSGQPFDPGLPRRGGCAKNPGQPHSPLWMTLGELRDRTKHLPDTLPLTVYTGGVEELRSAEWCNLTLDESALEQVARDGDEAPSLLLDAKDDFDTRQW